MFATASAVATTVTPEALRASESVAGNGRPQRISAMDRLGVAVVGVRGRGNSHIAALAAQAGVRILYVCDPDARVGEKRAREATRRQQGRPVRHVVDFREALADPSVDVVTIATPNHWQALAAAWSLQAGKDVLVEMPAGYCVRESRALVNLARRQRRVCHVGLPCRSHPGMREAMQYLHSGALGQVTSAEGIWRKPSPTVGARVACEPPRHLDYDLWLGPAPQAAVERQRFHYDWRWLWDYGGGELSGQAVQQLDLARWGLNVDSHPQRVLSLGGRMGDDQVAETANIQTAIYDFDRRRIRFDVRSEPRKRSDQKVGVIFAAEDGYLVAASHSAAVAFNDRGEKLLTFSGRGDPFADFLAAVRDRHTTPDAASIENGHRSATLCHLANISYRLGAACDSMSIAERLIAGGIMEPAAAEALAADWPKRLATRFGPLLRFDGAREQFVDGPQELAAEANRLLAREYRPPYRFPDLNA